MLESAIPERMRAKRIYPVATPQDYRPPFPGYCARFPEKIENLVMAIIGGQYTSPSVEDGTAISLIKKYMNQGPETVRPSFWEVVSVIDKKEAFNIAVIAYWPGTEEYKKWALESGFQLWWDCLNAEQEKHGWFHEFFSPSLERFETIFSNNSTPRGAANMQEEISGELKEHGYWGSMRDRLAAAQTDQLTGEKWEFPVIVNEKGSKTLGRRVQVQGKKNLCIIRSGQDWSRTLPDERKLYLETMHPVLTKGMNFLRDSGQEVGCYNMNLWDVVDSTSHKADQERTFGLGYFDDLASLERWSKSHQTHLNIFGGFLVYVKKLQHEPSLRLFHEILVLKPDQQSFEYVNCHEATGMLNSLSE